MSEKLSIIVIGRNEAKTLGAVFSRFKEFSASGDWDCQLVYVDSDSTDSSVAIAEEFRRLNPGLAVCILRLQGALNAAIARNAGIQYANPNSTYIFFLDGDIVFDPDFVREAIQIMDDNPKVGSVSGLLMDSYGTPGTESVARPVARSSRDNTRLWHGGNFIARKSVVEQVGLFDDHLVRHEDIDYSFRIRNEGYVLHMLQRRMGVHHTTAYMNPARVLANLRRGNYVYSGLFFRKYVISRRCLDMLKSISGVLFRCSVLCCALLSPLFYPAGAAALFGFAAVLGRKSTARRETVYSRALSFAAGIEFLMGLFLRRKEQKYNILSV